MKKRLGNFFVLCGLICLVIFFTSSSFVLDSAIFFFWGIGLTSLGLLLKRSSRSRRDKGKRRGRKAREKQDQDEQYD